MKKLSVIISIFLISLIVVAALFHGIGFRINLTESIPIGLYRIDSKAPIKNSYVIFCPDDRKSFRLARDRGYIDHGLYCNGYGYLMNKGVFVNHILTPYSKPKLQDGMKRSLPQWQVMNYQLQNDEVMTMTSQSEWSFDGRYYGLVHTGQIKGMITPIWVINKRREPHEL